jgi:hypothetical protein
MTDTGTEPNIKTCVLNSGYSGAGEDVFDAIIADARAKVSDEKS